MVGNFSVLIPARGQCEYLPKTLESICFSSTRPKEVIIVNDGLSQSAIKVIQGFSSELNIVLLQNEGLGIVSALNTGLNHCTSPLVARLDADDVVTINRFEAQVDFMRENPEVAVVGGQVNFINSNNEITGQSNYQVGRVDNTEDFKTKCMIAHPSAMIRTGMAHKVLGYRSVCTDGRTDFAEDFDFWLRISRIGQVHNLKEVVLLYREHENQVSRVHSQMQTFATAYISMVNSAEESIPDYVLRVLSPRKFSFGFLRAFLLSIPKTRKVVSKNMVFFEGFSMFFGASNSLALRIVRRLGRMRKNTNSG